MYINILYEICKGSMYMEYVLGRLIIIFLKGIKMLNCIEEKRVSLFGYGFYFFSSFFL